jgi:hypothetical protein
MTIEAAHEFCSRYRLAGLDGSPFTSTQIQAFEASLGLPLPAAYQGYLLIAGAEPPSGLIGSDCSGQDLLTLRDSANTLLEECGYPFSLPNDVVVFAMHQGYQFYFFHADGQSADPKVYYFMEGAAQPLLKFETFSSWVEAIVAR